MAVKYPTTDEVKQAFAGALPAAHEFELERWRKLEQGVMHPRWQPAGEDIKVLQALGARLFMIQWAFRIDKTNTSSEAAMRASIAVKNAVTSGG